MTTRRSALAVVFSVFAFAAGAGPVNSTFASTATTQSAAAVTLTVNKAGSGSGTVAGNIGGVDCGMPSCGVAVDGGTAVILTATPAAGSQFTGWLGPCTGAGNCSFTVSAAATAVATFAPAAIGTPTLDIDGDASYDALTDGLLAIRYLFGLSGPSLISGALATNATRNTEPLIAAYLADIRPLLDIDGNGQADALTDGLLIIRYLFGLRGNSLIAGAVGPGATRLAFTDIEALLLGIGSPGTALPPDPATVAPPPDPTVATTIFDGTGFLYTGPNPIQTGVAPGTIEARRAAVLRGGVRDASDAPLPGVTITVLGHPEFGQTLSRADGRFDLAVNGGGMLTLNYAKSGYLPVQRQIQVPWQDYVVIPDVAMIAPDSLVTTIDLNSPLPMQVARNSPVSDSDGDRRATLMIPAGTQATLVMPNGSTQPLTTLNIRATEYTVGANGPARMPGALPPASGYTYAVELSADEAMAAGARTLEFNQPLYNYVENFLGFPVGTVVPNGYYDRARGVWLPSENGRVIKITGVSAGAAQVDTVGTRGFAPLTLSIEERQQLAILYPVGQELWRVPIAHFTPWDHNWAFGPPDDAVKPADLPDTDEAVGDPCIQTGSSIIECENQILGETIGVVGTRFGLHYKSDRAPGRKTAYTLEIPLSGATLPASLRRIELEVLVAGRRFAQSFSPAPNQRQSFTWDGKDAYDREVQGTAEVTVRIGYVYGGVYREPLQDQRSFGAFASAVLTGSVARQEVTIWQESRRTLGTLRAPIGGWSLSPHHAYDPVAKVLHLGDGTRRAAEVTGKVITRAAPNLFGSSSTVVALVSDVSMAPDGTAYVMVGNGSLGIRVERVALNGTTTVVAGSATTTGALDSQARGIAVAPDASFYFTNHTRIQRVDRNGVMTTVAGGGATNIALGEGLPATQLAFASSFDVAMAADGGFYFTFFSAQSAGSALVGLGRVGPDGIYNKVAGDGLGNGFGGDGGPAILARLSNPHGLAVAPDGSIYIADQGNQRVRRIGTDGNIATVAGTGTFGFSGDGGLATQATLSNPDGLAVAPDGALYIADNSNFRVRRVGQDGIITTVAGNGTLGLTGDGGLATRAALRVAGVAVAADGSLYLAEFGLLRRVGPPLPGFSADESLIASADGSELYGFSAAGRHLQTRNAFTNALLAQFSYDSGGRLTAMTDGYGNVTTIQRDANGNPTAIVGPFGQSTALAVNANGYLSQITSPAGETVLFAYTAGGLLASLTNPRGDTSSYAFDAMGRLTSAAVPTGAARTMVRAGTNRDSTVTMTTSLGRVTTYRVEHLANGDKRRTTTDPAGKQIVVLEGQNGIQTATHPDGTTVSVALGPDPRWGMQAPVSASVVIATPGGKVSTTTILREAALTSPSNPLSMTAVTETTTINGRAVVRSYAAATRTFTTTSPTGRKKTTVIDLPGKPVQSQFGGLAPRSFAYDAKGRLASAIQGSGAGSRTTTLAYGAAGFLQSVTDPSGRSLVFARDGDGRTTGLTFPGGGQSGFAYDANGNFISITPPGRPAHLFTYTQNNQAATYAAPVVGVQNSQTQFAYNADRQPLQVDRPDGQSAALQYDSAGRPSLLDVAVGDTQYGYDAAGRLASLNRDQGAALAFAYDGGLPTGITWSGAVAGSLSRVYDNNFRITSHSVNGANPIALSYDLDGLPTQAGALTLTRNAQSGLVAGTALGTVSDTMTYDAFGEPATHTASQGGGAVYAAIYTRDALGRIADRSETIDGITRTFAYAYDPAGRLVQASEGGVVSASYTYDGNGNRLSRTDSGGTSNATYDAQDRLTQSGSTTYVHTANGDRLGKTTAGNTTGYQHDTFGNLTGVTLPDATQIDYLLDGGQRRVGRKVNGALVQGFLYQDGLKPIAELDGANSVVSRFVYSTGVNVPAYMIKGGVTYRIVTDHLGSPRLVIDAATGNIAQRLDYDEFGKVVADSNPGFQPFGFAGGLYDAQTGLVHFGAREYEPDTGRWTAKDPIGFGGGDANLYGYVLGDPVNRTDPRGLIFGDLLDAILKPLPIGTWGIPCPPGSGDTQGEANVRDALGNLIDDQVDDAVINLTGAKFVGPIGTGIDAATVAAQGFIIVHEAPREQRELIDTILSGSTVEADYAKRRYYAPNSRGPTPCPSGGSPCVR
ncbi:MAG: RHS repeat-associated core domain-containing protein [Betaproteobacteria bacterium]